DHLIGAVAEQALARWVEHLHDAARIDEHDAINGPLDHRAHALGALPQRLLRHLPLGQIADDADEDRPPVLLGFTDGEFHWKRGAAALAAEHFAADANDLAFTGFAVIIKVAVVLALIRL